MKTCFFKDRTVVKVKMCTISLYGHMKGTLPNTHQSIHPPNNYLLNPSLVMN